jgi:hypothetical protein
MSRRALVGFALVAAVLIAGAATLALAESAKPIPSLNGEWRFDASRSDSPEAMRAKAQQGGGPGGGMGGGPPGGGMGGGPPGGGMGGGPPGGGMGGGPPGGGMGGGPPGGSEGGEQGGGPGGQGAGGRSGGPAEQPPTPLPNRLLIEQSDVMVLLEDSTGTAVQAIMLGDASTTLPEKAQDALLLSGSWKKDKLQVERTTSRGTKIKQTYKLKDKGQTLEVETKIEGTDSMPSMSFKRVYEKVVVQ